ncbi:MAG: hypothetical protein KGS10_04560 [Chloroflexi bacterium]|nr:hypothetical protein [Chloroflexota bacterium]
MSVLPPVPCVFFDSHGGAWVTCDAEDPRAVAFGPAGCARELNAAEIEVLAIGDAASPFAAAAAQRRAVEAVHAHEWAWLPDGGTRLIGADFLKEALYHAEIAQQEAGICAMARVVRVARILALPLEYDRDAVDEDDILDPDPD